MNSFDKLTKKQQELALKLLNESGINPGRDIPKFVQYEISNKKIPLEYDEKHAEELTDFENQLIQDIDCDCLIRVNKKLDIQDIKKISASVYQKKSALVFIIANTHEAFGRVINKIHENQKEITLMNEYRYDLKLSGSDEKETIYKSASFDEKIKGKLVKSFGVNFYLYRFNDGKKDYILLSTDNLDVAEYNITGIVYTLADFNALGESAKIKSELPLIFCNTATPKISKYKSHVEFFKNVKKYDLTENKLKSYIFSLNDNNELNGKSARHPFYFESLVCSFLFSAKYDGYPLHLMILARQGTGKTTLEYALHHKFNEFLPIVEGSNSTIKALTPSFKNVNNPDPGAFARSSRFCVVDEFLRILNRVKFEDRETALGTLNPLLEHREHYCGSGQGGFKAKMTARLLAVTNEVYGTHSMSDLCEKLDNAFLSRLFIWFQDDDHIKYIQSGKGLQLTECTIEKNDFLSWIDYLHSFKSEFDINKINDIFNLFKPFIADRVLEVYEARYKHHYNCLLDGIIKLRCLTTYNSEFKAIDEDYVLMQNIVRKQIVGWKSNNLIENKPFNEIRKYLTKAEIYIYETLQQKKVKDSAINDIFSDVDFLSFYLENLKQNGIIKLRDHYYQIAEYHGLEVDLS